MNQAPYSISNQPNRQPFALFECCQRAWYGFRSLLLPSKQRRLPLAPERRVLADSLKLTESSPRKQMDGWKMVRLSYWVERPIVQELLLLVSGKVFFSIFFLDCEILTNAWQYLCEMVIFWKPTKFDFFGGVHLGNVQGGLGNSTSNWRWLNSLNVIPGLQMSAQSLSTAPIGLNTSRVTLPETNIAPENRPSQKKTSIPTIHFQVPR